MKKNNTNGKAPANANRTRRVKWGKQLRWAKRSLEAIPALIKERERKLENAKALSEDRGDRGMLIDRHNVILRILKARGPRLEKQIADLRALLGAVAA